MNQEEKELLQEILATEDQQLIVDAIKIVEEANVPNKEKALTYLRKYLVTINKQNYPIDVAKRQEERQQYIQSFSNALKKEREEKEEKKRIEEAEKEEQRKQKEIENQKYRMQMQKVAQAYGKQIVSKEGSKQKEENKNRILQKLQEVLSELGVMLNREDQLHKKFMESLQLDNDTSETLIKDTNDGEQKAKQQEKHIDKGEREEER